MNLNIPRKLYFRSLFLIAKKVARFDDLDPTEIKTKIMFLYLMQDNYLANTLLSECLIEGLRNLETPDMLHGDENNLTFLISLTNNIMQEFQDLKIREYDIKMLKVLINKHKLVNS